MYRLDGAMKNDIYMKALDDTAESVQMAAIKGLQMWGDKRALTGLRKFINSDSRSLRIEATRAVEDIERRDS